MPLAPEQTAAELLDALREQPEKADAYLSAEGSYRAFVQEQDVTAACADTRTACPNSG